MLNEFLNKSKSRIRDKVKGLKSEKYEDFIGGIINPNRKMSIGKDDIKKTASN